MGLARRAVLLGMLLCGWLAAARAENAPRISGAGRALVTGEDVADLCALAREVGGRDPGAPIWVDAWVYSPMEVPTELSSATIYFEPREVDGGHWRGWCLTSQAIMPRHRFIDISNCRRSGRWITSRFNLISEYIVLPPKGERQPVGPTGDCTAYRVVGIRSELDSATLIDLIETARGFSFVRRDGSELPFATLPMKYASAHANAAGETTATIRVDEPGQANFYMMNLQRAKQGWHIQRVYQTLCEGY